MILVYLADDVVHPQLPLLPIATPCDCAAPLRCRESWQPRFVCMAPGLESKKSEIRRLDLILGASVSVPLSRPCISAAAELQTGPGIRSDRHRGR